MSHVAKDGEDDEASNDVVLLMSGSVEQSLLQDDKSKDRHLLCRVCATLCLPAVAENRTADGNSAGGLPKNASATVWRKRRLQRNARGGSAMVKI